jgi:environmental stress-induced protein Ves
MYLHTKKAQLKTAQWAGGTTTQLAIYPETAEYQKFNFDFRISYATVEVEESTFTFMPGVTRHLMIMKGALDIDHEGQYKKHLDKFDKDIFSGEWPTKAKGKVMDFNLMTRGSAEGEIEAMILDRGDEREVRSAKNIDRTGIYLLKGNLEVKYNEEHIGMQEGDFILFTHEKSEAILVKAAELCETIIAKVCLDKTN